MSGPSIAGLSVLIRPRKPKLDACFLNPPPMSLCGGLVGTLAPQLTAESFLVRLRTWGGGLINPAVISGNRDISCDLLSSCETSSDCWHLGQQRQKTGKRKYGFISLCRLICCFSPCVPAVFFRPQTVGEESATSARHGPPACGVINARLSG